MDMFSGIDYLRIDIANNAGVDKVSFEERIAWVHEYEEVLEDIVDIAKKPFQYLAAVMAYRDAQRGIPTGHLVEMDAGASGCQMMAVLTGCKTTAKNTGLTGDICNDLYTITTKEMSLLMGKDVNIARDPVKKAQMTFMYGSKLKPKEVFGDGTDEYNAFHKANQTVAPGACELRDILISAWNPWALHHEWTMPDGFDVFLPTMVQQDVKIEVDEAGGAAFVYRHSINKGTEKGLSLAANVCHASDSLVVRELSRRCNYDVDKLNNIRALILKRLSESTMESGKNIPRIQLIAEKSEFYSLVGIEFIDENTIEDFSKPYLIGLLALVQDTLQYKSFPVVCIHDAFKAHANNCNRVRQVYIDIMAEIAESNMLSYIMSQITGKYFEVEKYSHNLGDEIREGNYAVS